MWISLKFILIINSNDTNNIRNLFGVFSFYQMNYFRGICNVRKKDKSIQCH